MLVLFTHIRSFFYNLLGPDLIRETGQLEIEKSLPRNVWIDICVIGFVQAVMTIIWMPEIRFLLANVSGDDSLLAHTLVYVESERFTVDVGFIEFNKMGLASFLNLIPIFFYKYFGIDPQYFYIFFLYIQCILRPVGIYFLCYAITRIRGAGWICAFLLEIFSAQQNLAYYNIFWHMPYVGNMGLLFASFSAGCFLLRRNKLGWFFHICCSFMHMSLGLMWGGMLFCFFAFQAKRFKDLKYLVRVSSCLLVIFLLSSLPAIIFNSNDIIPFPESLKESLLQGGHAAIWRVDAYMAYFWSSLFFLIFLSCLLLLSAKRIDVDTFNFVLGCTISMWLTCAIQIVAVYIGFIPIVQGIFTRSSFLFVYLFVPILVALLCKLSLQNNIKMGILTCMIIIFNSPVGLAAGTSFYLYMSAKKDKVRNFLILINLFILCMTIFLLPIINIGQIFNISLFSDTSFVNNILMNHFFASHLLRFGFHFLALLFLYLIFYKLISVHSIEKFKLLATILIAGFVFMSSAYYLCLHLREAPYGGRDKTENHAYWDIQEWVAVSTDTNASFIVIDSTIYGSWRSLTRRSVIKTAAGGGLYGYTERTDHHNKQLAEWVNQHIGSEYIVPDWPYTILHGSSLIKRLDEEQLLDFTDVFGGDYVVVKKTTKEWDFPIAYENEIFIVYALSLRANEKIEESML